MGTFATPDHKSRADAASWVARRLQDGANRDQILLELRQDGVSPADAEDVYGRVRTSLRSLSVPRVGVLVRVAALLLPTVALGGWLWSMVKLGPHSDEGYVAAVMTAMLVAVAIGTMTALATVLGSGIGRNWRMVLIAVLGDVAALVAPSRLVNGHGTDALLTEAAVPVAALITCGVLLCIPRPHYVLSVDQSGAFRWSRISDNPSPWSRVFGGRTPWHDPQTSLYEMGVRAPASPEG